MPTLALQPVVFPFFPPFAALVIASTVSVFAPAGSLSFSQSFSCSHHWSAEENEKAYENEWPIACSEVCPG
jgi:hypothetical protein